MPEQNRTDPYVRPDAPSGRFFIPHAGTFSGIYASPARTYRWWYDEALRNSLEDARAMRRDAFIFGLLRARQMPTAQLPYSIEVDDISDPIQRVLAREIKNIIDNIPRIRRIFLHLLEAIWYGRFGVQLKYGIRRIDGQDYYMPVDSHPVSGDKIVFKWSGVPGILINPVTLSFPDFQYYQSLKQEVVDRGVAIFLYERQWRDQFIIHKHEPEDLDYLEGELAGSIHGLGLRSRIYWLWWLRQEIIAWLLNYLQRVGAGGIIEIPYELGNDDSYKAAQEIEQRLAQSNIVYVPQVLGRDTNYLHLRITPPNHAGSQIFIEIVKDYERKITQAILGVHQLERAYGYGVHMFMLKMLSHTIAYDANLLQETLTTDLVDPLIRYNFPGVYGKYNVRFRFDASQMHVEEVLKNIKMAFDMGLTIKADDLRKKLGISTPKQGDEILSRTLHQPTYATPFMSGVVQPHMMRRKDYIIHEVNRFISSANTIPSPELLSRIVKEASETHMASVLHAIESGLDIPEEVKSEYEHVGDIITQRSNEDKAMNNGQSKNDATTNSKTRRE
jgi:hypothetical protein